MHLDAAPIGYGPFLAAQDNSPFLFSRLALLDPVRNPIARLCSSLSGSFVCLFDSLLFRIYLVLYGYSAESQRAAGLGGTL